MVRNQPLFARCYRSTRSHSQAATPKLIEVETPEQITKALREIRNASLRRRRRVLSTDPCLKLAIRHQ